MVGTFYRKAAPEKPVFVNVDDSIEPGKVICILEAMKLFNEIEAEFKCKIIEILKDDAAPVEFGEPLFKVERLKYRVTYKLSHLACYLTPQLRCGFSYIAVLCALSHALLVCQIPSQLCDTL